MLRLPSCLRRSRARRRLAKRCGGTVRLAGAGEPLKTRAGEVEARVVARAVVAARPVGAHVGGGADLLLERGRAAEVGADALDDEELGLDRALRALHVVGLLGGLRLRIGQERRRSARAASSISGVRRRTQTGLPRHSTVICWPGSSLQMSTSTGAPAASARALGNQLSRNGAATPPASGGARGGGGDEQQAALLLVDVVSDDGGHLGRECGGKGFGKAAGASLIRAF